MTTHRNTSRHGGAREDEFSVPIAQLAKAPGSRREVHFVSTLDGLEVSGAAVPAGEPVAVDVVLESVSEGILVSGTVKTRYTGVCRRCLAAVSEALIVPVRELCTAHPMDEETYLLRPDVLDLAPIVHDACILALPLALLCREECRGLCPDCGANRNLEQCSCEIQPDPRWSALDLLSGIESTGPGDDVPARDE